MVARAGYFGAHNLLSGLPREYSSRLLARAPTISLEKGQTLFDTGAVGDGCYWLEEGVLKVSIASPQGGRADPRYTRTGIDCRRTRNA